MRDWWIIEARGADGTLDLSAPQPETVFGNGAITGMTSDEMAKTIFRRLPGAVLDGRFIATWAQVFDSRFVARRKTW